MPGEYATLLLIAPESNGLLSHMLFREGMTVLIEITFKWLDAGMDFIKRRL